jgi:hypothetical protein
MEIYPREQGVYDIEIQAWEKMQLWLLRILRLFRWTIKFRVSMIVFIANPNRLYPPNSPNSYWHPIPEKNRIRYRIKPSTAKWKGDSTWQGKHDAPHIAAKQGRSSMRLETPKAVLKIFRPMSEHTERTWPIGLEQRRPARGPRSPKVNCQLVIGHKIVDLITFSNIDKKANTVMLSTLP